MSLRPLLQTLLALALLAASGASSAGRVHPDLDKHLKEKAEGDLTAVIVELEERVSPSAAGATAPERDRRARGRAVVDALKDKAEKTQGPIRKLLEQEGPSEARKVQPLWVVNAIALEASEKLVRKLAQRNDVREVRADKSIKPPRIRRTVAPEGGGAPPAWNIAQIQAPQVWELGYSGTGIVVGSFDTGVDGSHPDLIPNYRGNHAISWFDPYHQHSEPVDTNGHGTHTTGTMVASGEFSGFRIGVAPGARWIAAKGWNNADNATASAFHQIFEWFLAPGGDPANAPDVVNASWGMDPPSCDPEFVTDVQALRAAGIVPVFASGNSGPDPSTTLAPGSYATSFSVGATDFVDEIAEFSSQGPSQCDGAVKPDVSAPGVAIYSTLPGAFHFELDGTSMAAPHVSGAAAVLRSITPSLTVEEIEAAIVDGSVEAGPPGPDNAFGAGRLDLLRSASLVLGIPLVGIEASAHANELGVATGRFTVRRTGSTASDLVVPYSVAGTATPGSDYVPLPGSVTIPAGASTATINVTPIDDPEVELTETVVVTLASSAAYLVSPAQATVNVASDELLPDLVISTLSMPDIGGAGLTITVNETTRNNGPGASPATTTSYFLSANTTLDAGDTPLGSRSIVPLAPGASSSGSIVLTIPAGTVAGTWYVVTRANATGVVPETNELNNFWQRFIYIGPDLTVASLTSPSSAGAGQAIPVTVATRNTGAGSAPASSTQIWYSDDFTLGAGDVLLATVAVPVLAAGATDTATVSVTLPAAAAPGARYLLALADSAATVAETTETNNSNYRIINIGSDLVADVFTVPSTGGAGLALTLSDTTRNAGGGTAPATTTRFYLSTNLTLDASDVPLGSRAVPALAGGSSSTASTSVTVPAGTATGSYFVLMVVDADGVAAESSEVNNVAFRGISIGPDLVVASLTAPASAGAGETISVTVATRNAGAGSAAASSTQIWYSDDGTLGSGDVLLTTVAVPVLAPGATDTATVSVTLPAAAAAGTRYLIAQADSSAAVAETSETNNSNNRTLTVGTDLTVTSVTGPDYTGAGLAITVGDTTRNSGGAAAPASTTSYYLSTNTTFDAGDTPLGSRSVPALAPGATNTGSAVVTVPAGTAAGTWYLFARADADGVLAESNEANNAAYRAIYLGPDLVVASLTAPSAAGAGQAISVTVATRNTGAGGAAATSTQVWYSDDGTIGAGDVLLATVPVPALAAGATDTATVSVTLPATALPGTRYVLAMADSPATVAETTESNNSSYRMITIGPDLIVASLTAPASAGAGQTISVTVATRNSGAGAAAASSTQLWYSDDPNIGAGDVLMATVPVPALAAGVTDTATVSVTLPATASAGTRYVLALADSASAVAESIETNNSSYRSITVGVDLVVASLTAPAAAGAGETISVTVATRNAAAGTAAASSTQIWYSEDWVLGAGDVLLTTVPVPALAAGATDTATVSVTLPAAAVAGTRYVIALADSASTVAETSEGNNSTYRAITVGTDLTITSVTGPDYTGAGLSITVGDTTRNGGGSAPASTTSYYLSTNTTFDAGDTLLGSRSVPPLAPGATHTGSAVVTIPAGTSAGTWYLFARADADGVLAESNEANNTTYRALYIGPDLTLASLTSPSSAGAGQAISITVATRNTGAGSAPASSTQVWYSDDWTLSAGDVLLATVPVPVLAAGATDTQTVSVTLPAAAVPGTRYLLAMADSPATVAETTETNNFTYRTIYIGPDLVADNLTVPSTVGAGLSMTLSDTTRNAGGGAAPATTTRFYLSTNLTLDGSDVPLGSRAVPALAGGASSAASTSVTVPAGTTPGSYFVLMVVEADGVVVESNEVNNATFRGVTVN